MHQMLVEATRNTIEQIDDNTLRDNSGRFCYTKPSKLEGYNVFIGT